MDETFLKEQTEMIIEIQKRAYQSGFEAGQKAKERELMKEGEIEEAKVKQVEEKENPF